jgi:hypothetical protein
MMELLNGSGASAERADRATKRALAAAAEAQEASKEAMNQHDSLRELVVKLQISRRRARSRLSIAESPAIPDLVMDQPVNSVDEAHPPLNTSRRETAPIRERDEPIGSPAAKPDWQVRVELQHEWDRTARYVGQLYEANTDPEVLNEAVARAREA